MFSVGSIHSYVKQKSLKVKAEQNVKDYRPPSPGGVLSDLLEHMKAETERQKLGAIMSKLQAGKRLSDQEKDYLKQTNPQLYQEYEMADAERRAFGKKLDKAKSRQEAAYLHQSKLHQLYDETRPGQAAQSAGQSAIRTAAIQAEYNDYIANGRGRRRQKVYSKLPAGILSPGQRRKALAGYQDALKTAAQTRFTAGGRKSTGGTDSENGAVL